MTRIFKRTKTLALLSMLVAVTVFGAVVFTASATEEGTAEETTVPCRGLPDFLLDELTEEQRETLQSMIEEKHADNKANREEINAQLEEWGIEVPEAPQHAGGFLEDLTEEQKEELKTMRQEFHDARASKLEEWEIEVPEFDGVRPGRLGPCRP